MMPAVSATDGATRDARLARAAEWCAEMLAAHLARPTARTAWRLLDAWRRLAGLMAEGTGPAAEG